MNFFNNFERHINPSTVREVKIDNIVVGHVGKQTERNNRPWYGSHSASGECRMGFKTRRAAAVFARSGFCDWELAS